jgi:hypothetical protein
MTRPGDRLRALATQMFDADTMERLVDPVIADLQTEYTEASRAGRVWRRRWVRLSGYIAFAKVSMQPLRVFLAVMFAVTMLLMVPPYLTFSRYVYFRFVYVLPQALVVATPLALTIALAWSRPARQSRQWLRAIVVSGVICSAFCFVTLAWWLPSANQAFRVSIVRQFGGSAKNPPNLPELTIGELRRQVNWTRTVHAEWRELFFTYYMRWAFPCASLSFALLMIALHRRGMSQRLLLVSTVPMLFGYYVLVFVGRSYAIDGTVSELTAFAAAWMPNVITLLIAAIAMLGTRRLVTE